MGVSLFSQGTRGRTRGSGLRLCRGGLGWVLGTTSSSKGLSSTVTGCPGKRKSHPPWRNLKGIDVVLRDMVRGGIGGGGLMDSLLVKWLHQLEQGSDKHKENSKREYVEVGGREKVATFCSGS